MTVPIHATLFQSKPTSCNAGSDGALYVNATGDLPLVFNWVKYNGSTPVPYSNNVSSSLSSIPAGQYGLEILSAQFCRATFTYTVTEPRVSNIIYVIDYNSNLKYAAVISISTTTVAPTCSASGSIRVNVTGGSPGYNVTLMNSNGDAMPVNGGFIDSLPQDFYNVIVVDANKCSVNSEVALVQPCMFLSF